jgi:tRNA(fMet)-specific endonuclease VapC
MPTIVVDTDVVSYLFRSDSRALLYLPNLQDTVPVITFQTVAELHFWTLTRQWGAARQA